MRRSRGGAPPQISVVIDDELARLLEHRKVHEGQSTSAIVRAALRNYLGIAAEESGYREGYNAAYSRVMRAMQSALAEVAVVDARGDRTIVDD